MDPIRQRYWKTNLKLVGALLGVWFLFGCVLSIWLVEPLNNLVEGFPLGFWIAQQGSIYVFIILILIYALKMNRLDDRLEADLQQEDGAKGKTE